MAFFYFAQIMFNIDEEILPQHLALLPIFIIVKPLIEALK